MKKSWLIIAVLLALAGGSYGVTLIKAGQVQQKAGYVCPLTGEELPCPSCCPGQ